ncbi:cytochrome-c oxidase, cbb3-type subunit III [Nitratireductor sp. L1-7-SE]|uniref:Cbb3-type cytochrome c oxidase subunit n=1 Tax=Nitratireductor rhodophyticola TaxID=2854036 RepID=A0ABS7R7V4_9HYPH|nr:cytochrome-c oxidase, cbb3-type subunit III [Nitratireductor rhodophyticola]MBY8916734.1 cytochrome-c oxidase, cbb3-type subunit III [Nitratireductor rhodophyticola]MBY8920837.1 cytochrome-c oxidase, cbb3-type subunit III [Nitratireductor rhodophyticola]
MSEKEHIDEVSGVSTTGHEWDGIRELDNPMPRWWVWTFYATIVWSIGYTIAYPAWPLISDATRGVLGYSSRQELTTTMEAVSAEQADLRAAIAEKPLDEILADETLRRFATAAGDAAFKVNCSQCHGSGAQGSAGYPNLNDDDWLWGGDIEAIHQTIAHGVRFDGDDDTRFGEMPAFGDILSGEEIRQVAAHVVSFTGTPSDPALAEAGAQVYADNCASCHGDAGQGDVTFGAPNLADAIWLYGSSEAQIAAQVRQPRHGVMPAWQERLGDPTVKQLSVYVYSLGGGE